jgi:EAL domain-containing protein (putative c-di-GMP-specific phosphodiesterase class I)
VSPVPGQRSTSAAPDLEPGVRAVLASGGAVRLRLVAQPIVDLATSEVAGYELLARFDGGPASPPDAWFATARRIGLGAELNALVVRRALELRPTLPPNRFLTVNVEPDVLTAPPVLEPLLSTDLGALVVELTEHRPVAVDEQLRGVLDALRSRGAMVAVDDAGTGYSGLSHLLALRPDLVKVDRDLVAGIDTDRARRRLVEVLGDLCGRIDAWLLAEGVETAAECGVLLELGVPLAQGWHLGRPAAPWCELDDATRRALVVAGSRAELVEHVASLVRDAETGGVRVLRDVSGRVRTVRWTLGSLELESPAVTLAAATGVTEALQRALTRPPEHRWAPLLVTDARGAVVGRLDVADLAARVASRSSDR